MSTYCKCLLPLQTPFPPFLFTVSPQKGWQAVWEKRRIPKDLATTWKSLTLELFVAGLAVKFMPCAHILQGRGKINSLYNICIVFRIANIYKKQQGKYRMQISISVSASKQPKMAWKFGGHGLSEYGSRSGLLGAGSLCKSYKINKRL